EDSEPLPKTWVSSRIPDIHKTVAPRSPSQVERQARGDRVVGTYQRFRQVAQAVEDGIRPLPSFHLKVQQPEDPAVRYTELGGDGLCARADFRFDRGLVQRLPGLRIPVRIRVTIGVVVVAEAG